MVSGGCGAFASAPTAASSVADEKKEEVVEQSVKRRFNLFGPDISDLDDDDDQVMGVASSPAEEKKEEVVEESDDDDISDIFCFYDQVIISGESGGDIVSVGGVASSPAEDKREEAVEESDADIISDLVGGYDQGIIGGVSGGGIVSGGCGSSTEEEKEVVVEESVDDQLHIMDDARSVFVVLCYEDSAPYICSIVELRTQVDTESGKLAPKYLAHVKQPQVSPPCRWLFSPIPSSTYDLFMVPAWYHDDGNILFGARFNGSTKSLQAICPPIAQKFGGHVVTVRRNIYFIAHPYAYSLIPGGHGFERYIPDNDVWEDIPSPNDVCVVSGPQSTIVASAVWGDDTILMNIGGCQILAYHVIESKWYPVFVANTNNNRCLDIVGEGFVVKNIVYALSKLPFNTVLALSIQKKEVVTGDLQYSCSLHSEIVVRAMKQIKDEAYLKTRHFVHLGEDNFCLVQSCEYRFDVECQPIHLTILKLMGEDKMVVMKECNYLLRIQRGEFHWQFRIGLCFSQPDCKTTALQKGETTFIFDPCGGLVFREEQEDDVEGNLASCSV